MSGDGRRGGGVRDAARGAVLGNGRLGGEPRAYGGAGGRECVFFFWG